MTMTHGLPQLRAFHMAIKAWHHRLDAILATTLIVLVGHVAAAPSRAVAVLYDDSGSMQQGTRWTGANFSLQVMASLLNDGDVLLLSKMNSQPQPRRYEVPSGIDALLTDLQSEPAPNGNTPYAGVDQLLRALKESQAAEKWLLVVTDGDFEGFTAELAQRQIDAIVKPLGIRVVFLLIESRSGFDAARYWQRAAGATIVQAASGAEVPLRMEEIATMLTGRDASGVRLARDGSDWVLSSLFPLRGVVALLQGDSDVRVNGAMAGQIAMTVRSHRAKARTKTLGIPHGANIAHLLSKDGIAAGDKVVRIQLSGLSDKDRFKIYPEVAARLEVDAVGADGKSLSRDPQGSLVYCQGEHIDLQTRLVGPGNQPITVGRSDLSTFEVGFTQDTGPAIRPLIDTKQERFTVRVKPVTDQRLVPFARYPGYFSYLGEPLNLRGISCKREVAVTMESHLNADGIWTQRVDQLEAAPPLVFGITIDGRPATDLDIKDWRWQPELQPGWELRVSTGKLYFIPRQGCCAKTWSRPKAHRGSIQLQSLTTGNARDVIRLPAPVTYEWTLPVSVLGRLWWLFGCPVAALLGMLATVAYLWRILITKERFGRRAAVHVLRRRTDTKVPFCRTKDLPKRLLWPSRRETKVIEGLKFIAVGRGGHAVLVEGKNLTNKYEIDNWQFDEQLQDLKRPQRDARLKDQSIIARRPSGGYRAEDVDLKVQYAQRGQPSNWSH